jgi:hypothetical protein
MKMMVHSHISKFRRLWWTLSISNLCWCKL